MIIRDNIFVGSLKSHANARVLDLHARIKDMRNLCAHDSVCFLLSSPYETCHGSGCLASASRLLAKVIGLQILQVWSRLDWVTHVLAIALSQPRMGPKF